MRKLLFMLFFASTLVLEAFISSCRGGRDSGSGGLQVFSNDFQYGGPIPQVHALMGCDGQNISPHLRWTNIPNGTKSFVVIIVNRDAYDFVHWILYDIPASITELQRGFNPSGNIKQGMNDYGFPEYGGPCPPPGETHRYFFRVYAINQPTLGLNNLANKEQVRQAMQGKILGQGELMGTFSWSP